MNIVRVGDIRFTIDPPHCYVGRLPRCSACGQLINNAQDRGFLEIKGRPEKKLFFHRICTRKVAQGMLFLTEYPD